MAEVLQLSDGSVHTVFDIKDMMEHRTLRKRSKVSGHTTGKS